MPNVTRNNFNTYWIYATNMVNALNYYYQLYQNEMVKKQKELTEDQMLFFKEQIAEIYL